MPDATLNWKEHDNYQSARNCINVIYLFEWKDKPFYWGIAAQFGKRYNVGYRHLIEGSLKNGGKLYTASIQSDANLDIKTIENDLIVRYGHVMNSRYNSDADPLKLAHEGDTPACIHGNDNAPGNYNAPDREQVPENVRFMSYTFAQQTPFLYEIAAENLTIWRGNNFCIHDTLDGNTVIELLKKIQSEFGGDTFPLDNSVMPADDREIGLGTTVVAIFREERGFAQVASQLARLLCDAGVLQQAGGRGHANNPTRYRLIYIPESWSELRVLLEAVSDNDENYMEEAA